MFAVVKVSIVFLKAQIANLSGTIRRSGNMEPTFPCGYSCLELSKVLPIMGQGAGHFAVICLLCRPYFVTWLHVFNFPTPISDVNMPQKREHADKFILLVGPTLQALPTKFPFWLCVVYPYIIQSWGKGRIYQAGRCRKLAGVQLWSREGTEQPVPPVSAFFLIRD